MMIVMDMAHLSGSIARDKFHLISTVTGMDEVDERAAKKGWQWEINSPSFACPINGSELAK
jgi:hypothetical protein